MTTPAHPLEYHLVQLEENKGYLTAPMIVRIQALAPDKPEKKARGPAANLQGMLDRIFKTMERLESLSNSSEDIGEVKQVITAMKDLFNTASKAQDAIAMQNQILAMEEAIADALRELGNTEIQTRYLAILKAKIEAIPAS